MNTQNKFASLQSYDDACKIMGKSPIAKESLIALLGERDGEYQYAMQCVITGVDAAKKLDAPDQDPATPYLNYDDDDQEKRYPFWDMETYDEDAVPGSGFSLDGVCYDYTGSLVGARQTSLSEEAVRHLVQVFFEQYRVIMKQQ